VTAPRDPSQLNDAIWVEDIGFIAHNGRYDPEFPHRTFTERKDLEKTLRKSGKLPDLGRAPIASWYLARLAHLCGKRFPYKYGGVLGSDGADYWLRMYCLKRPATVSGILHCTGKQTEIRLSLQHQESENAAPVLDKFIRALLQAPAELSRCKVIVQYTEFTDPDLKFHIPRVYGWNGLRYFNEGAPQHAIDPDDYE
jgi:hypothetical protein